jgi:VPDSG-CTERM motif
VTIRRILLGLLVLAMMSLPLSANITFSTGGVSCSGGLCTPYASATTITFDGSNGNLLPQTFGLAQYIGIGTGSPFVNGSVSGEYAAPPSDTTDYLTVGSPNRPSEVDIIFSQSLRYFGMYFGSPDAYNHITFQFQSGATTFATFTGDQLSTIDHGDQTVGVYVNFFADAAQAFDKVVMTSTSPAFESDNHAYSTTAVPDGGTTASLLGLALGFVGLLSRRLK